MIVYYSKSQVSSLWRPKIPVNFNLTNFATRRVRKLKTKSKFYERWHILKTSYRRTSAVKMDSQAEMLHELMEVSNVNKHTLRMIHESRLHLNISNRLFQVKVLYGQAKSIEVNLELNAHP